MLTQGQYTSGEKPGNVRCCSGQLGRRQKLLFPGSVGARGFGALGSGGSVRQRATATRRFGPCSVASCTVSWGVLSCGIVNRAILRIAVRVARDVVSGVTSGTAQSLIEGDRHCGVFH